MSATEAQLAFASEFVLFLAALAGAALVLLRPGLFAAGRFTRWALTGGFVALGVAAFVHGSLIREDPQVPLVLAPRLLGLALLAGGVARRWVPAPALVLRLSVAVLAVAELVAVVGEPGVISDVVRMVGAVVMAGMMALITQRSIPARVAAGAGGTVLLVVLAVSITLSSVIVGDVQRGELDRMGQQAEFEARGAEENPTHLAQVRADNLAEIVGGAVGSPQVELLRTLADAPGSPEAEAAQDELSAALRDLAAGSGFVLSGADVAVVTPTGTVVAGSGLDGSEEIAQLGTLGVVREAREGEVLRSGLEVAGARLLAVGAAPAYVDEPGGQFLGIAVVADEIDERDLLDAKGAERGLGMAVVGRDGLVVGSGDQPSADVLREIASQVMGPDEVRVRRHVDGRFVGASPLFRNGGQGQPEAVLVMSVPDERATETRERLFKTLFLVALVGTLVAIVLASLVGRGIGSALQRLTSTAEQIQSGNLDVEVGLRTRDELGVLGVAFDRMAGSLRTMTDELREAAIDEARLRGRLEAVIGGMGEAIVAVDARGVVSEFNRAAEDLFGAPAAQVRGEAVGELSIVGPKGEDLAQRLADPPEGAWAAEATVSTPDGDEVPVAVTGTVLRGAAGEVAGSVALVRDMRREREVDRMKTEFLSNISHEMKTPLTPIKGYAQMLSTRDLPPERSREFATEIVTGARQLERVINQLVNFATMAAGRLEPNPVDVSAEDVLDDVVERWAGRVGDAHVVEREVPSGTPHLFVDRRLIDLSLDELVDNAVKYSPEGGRVVISAVAAPNGDGRPSGVLVSVADPGVGVPDDRLDDIFGEFAQGDGSATREFGGLGLGLPMVRHVARAHGGDLSCESSPGEGSTFTLRLPASDGAPSDG